MLKNKRMLTDINDVEDTNSFVSGGFMYNIKSLITLTVMLLLVSCKNMIISTESKGKIPQVVINNGQYYTNQAENIPVSFILPTDQPEKIEIEKVFVQQRHLNSVTNVSSYFESNGGTINDVSNFNLTEDGVEPGLQARLIYNEGEKEIEVYFKFNTKEIVVVTKKIYYTANPYVFDVRASKLNGTYKAGVEIDIEVKFTNKVIVTGEGTSTLALNSGEGVKAEYSSGSGTETLVYKYTVGDGQNTNDLDYEAEDSLVLDSQTIKSEHNYDAKLKLPEPGGLGSLGSNSDIVIDTTSPGKPIVSCDDPSNSPRPEWRWTSGGGDGDEQYRYKLDDDNLQTGATETTELNFTPGSDLVDGNHTLYVQERDNVGNWSETGSCSTEIVDNTPPEAPIVSCDDPSNNPKPEWKWETGGGDGAGQYRYKLDDDNLQTGATETIELNFTPGSDLSYGNHTLYVQERDSDGNWSDSGSCINKFVAYFRQYGLGSAEHGRAIALDSTDNVIIAGAYNDVTNVGGDNFGNQDDKDVFVAKYDSSGTYLWSFGFDGDNTNQVNNLVLDSNNNIYLCGSYKGSVNFGGVNPGGVLHSTSGSDSEGFLVKYSSSGVYQWAKTFGSNYGSNNHGEACNDLAVDSSDNVIIVGVFDYTVYFGGEDIASSANLRDWFIVKYNHLGVHQWSHRKGGSLSDAANSIAISVSNDIYIAGYFKSGVNFGCGELQSKENKEDYVIVKYSESLDGTSLECKWSKAFGSDVGEVSPFVAVDSGGDAYLFGMLYNSGPLNFGGDNLTSKGGKDIFIAKLKSSDGTHVWSTSYGSSGDDIITDIITDSDNNLYITGGFQGPIDFGGGLLGSPVEKSIVVAKYNHLGVHQWSNHYGETAFGRKLALDSEQKKLWVTGSFKGDLTFDGVTSTSYSPEYDIFLLGLDP